MLGMWNIRLQKVDRLDHFHTDGTSLHTQKECPSVYLLDFASMIAVITPSECHKFHEVSKPSFGTPWALTSMPIITRQTSQDFAILL